MKNLCYLLISVSLFSGVWMADFRSAPGQANKNGQRLYETYCMSCHMADGNGVEGVYPTLIRTNTLTNKNLLVKLVLQGMRGEIEVKGVKYNGEMAPINLTDTEVADVLNYVRNSWGNKASLIRPSEVTVAKKTTVKGFQPY